LIATDGCVAAMAAGAKWSTIGGLLKIAAAADQLGFGAA
jgi:hypothetical protein